MACQSSALRIWSTDFRFCDKLHINIDPDADMQKFKVISKDSQTPPSDSDGFISDVSRGERESIPHDIMP